MLRYQNNAFRVLGLRTNASTTEIMQRVNEIKVKHSLNMDISYDFDFPWMGSVDRSEQNVINALQRLENPVSRLKEEISWFWVDTDIDKKAMNCLISRDRQAAHEIWKSVTIHDQINENTVSAFVNQIILSHGSVIGKELSLKYKEEDFGKVQRLTCSKCSIDFEEKYRFCIHCGKKLKIKTKGGKGRKKNIDLSEKHWNNWRFAINRIVQFSSEESFWTNVSQKAKRINDPRLTANRIDEIQENFLPDMMSSNFKFLSQALASKDYERVKKHSGLLNGSSLSVEVVREGFNVILSPQIAFVNKYCKSASAEVRAFERSQKNDPETIIKIYLSVMDNILPAIHEGKLVDINCVCDFALSRDNIASEIKNMAIILNNLMVADNRMCKESIIWGYKQSYKMLKKSIELAGSQYVRQQFMSEEETIERNMSIIGYTPSIKDAVSDISSRPFLSRYFNTSVGGILKFLFVNWWIVLVVIFFIVGAFEDKTPKRSSASSSKSYSGSQRGSSSEVQRLSSRIDTLKLSVDKKEKQVAESASAINVKYDYLERLEKEVEAIESRGLAQSSWAYRRYEQKIDEYNELLESYNKNQDTHMKLYEEYKEEFELGNKLVNEYNRKIK